MTKAIQSASRRPPSACRWQHHPARLRVWMTSLACLSCKTHVRCEISFCNNFSPRTRRTAAARRTLQDQSATGRMLLRRAASLRRESTFVAARANNVGDRGCVRMPRPTGQASCPCGVVMEIAVSCLVDATSPLAAMAGSEQQWGVRGQGRHLAAPRGKAIGQPGWFG